MLMIPKVLTSPIKESDQGTDLPACLFLGVLLLSLDINNLIVEANKQKLLLEMH